MNNFYSTPVVYVCFIVLSFFLSSLTFAFHTQYEIQKYYLHIFNKLSMAAQLIPNISLSLDTCERDMII